MKKIHNKNNVPWLKARDGLISTVVSLEFPAELGEVAARHLGEPESDRTDEGISELYKTDRYEYNCG